MESPALPHRGRVQGVCREQFEALAKGDWHGPLREQPCGEEGAGDSGEGKPLAG